eukprot:m51a1_g6057 putative adenylate guanylate cyclase (1237) ;mRNA; r:232758-237582
MLQGAQPAAEGAVILHTGAICRAPRLSAGHSLWRSLRVRVFGVAVVCVAVLVAAIVASVVSLSASSLRRIERDMAVENVQVALRGFVEEAAALKEMIRSWNLFEALYQYMIKGNPQGAFFESFASEFNLRSFKLSGMLFYKQSGEFFNGVFYDRDSDTLHNVSNSIKSSISSTLLAASEVYGFLRDDEKQTINFVSSGPIGAFNYSGLGETGWLVFTRDVQLSLPKIASTSNLCMAVMVATRSLSPGTAKVISTRGMQCSTNANETDSSYYGVASVLGDSGGDALGYLYIQNTRPLFHLITSTEKKLVAGSVAVLVGIVAIVALALEFAVIRVLHSFSKRIVEIGFEKCFNERVGAYGRSTELNSVAGMVNSLLDSLEREKEQTELIMINTFPAHVIDDIKSGVVPCDFFPQVTFLIADICNFTLWSSRTPARQVANYLNEIFSMMDTILDKYTAIKVCTIGDAYVAVSGIPRQRDDDAAQIVQVAQEFRLLCRSKKMDLEQDLLFRMGIATGPCSASLVGSKKLKYEVWGDAATQSEKIQVSAEPGEILCCSRTYEKLSSAQFSFGSCRTVPLSETATANVYPVESPQQMRKNSSNCGVGLSCRSSQIGDLGALYIEPKGSWASRIMRRVNDGKGDAQTKRSLVSSAKLLVGSLRLRATVELFAVCLVGVAVVVGVLFRVNTEANNALVQQIGEGNIARLASMLVSTESEMQDTTVSWATWDKSYKYMLSGEAFSTVFWTNNYPAPRFFRVYRMDAVMYIMKNGTLRRGDAYSVYEDRKRNLSDAEVAVVTNYLVQHGEFVGIMTDPVDKATRIVSASKVKYDDGTGDDIGWLVMTRDVRILFKQWANDSAVCVGGATYGADVPSSFASLYKAGNNYVGVNAMELDFAGTSVRAKLMDGFAERSMSTGEMLYVCPGAVPSRAVVSGAVIANSSGGEGFLAFAAQRTDHITTQESALWNIAVIVVVLIVVAPIACLAIIELLFFRPLSSLRTGISQITQGNRLHFKGIRELSDIAVSVNYLLDSIESEEGISNSILSNMFPPHIYAALLKGRKTMELTETFDHASILFSQVQGFATWSSATPPKEVLQFLNSVVEQMDTIVEAYGVVKVKTIQDIYMAISGVPQQSADSTARLARVALRFRELSVAMGGSPMRLQIGVSTGPCSGGIIGKSMWLYDIWSDTVNLAARLRAKAGAGVIMCCTTTRECLAGSFDFGEPLEMQLKGKGKQTLHPLLSEN